MPAATPAHENMNAANVDLGNLMRQRRPRKPDAALSAQMRFRCGSDADQMRLRCGSDVAQTCGSASADAAQMRLRCPNRTLSYRQRCGSEAAQMRRCFAYHTRWCGAQQCWWHRQRPRPFSKKWKGRQARWSLVSFQKTRGFERSAAHTRCAACLLIWYWVWHAAIKHIRFAK